MEKIGFGLLMLTGIMVVAPAWGQGTDAAVVKKLQINVPILAAFATNDLAVVRQAFASATPCDLGQAWLAKPEPAFEPATVRAGWRDGTLLVLAELEDRDIYNTATGLNQQTFLLGDTFEMFLRATGCESYVEFHVTPDNQHLQLRIPGTGRVREAAHLDGAPFRSATWVDRHAGKWWVYAEIPAASVCETAPQPLSGQQWLFSFSRYDYTRPDPKPVLSSSSPHHLANFHRQSEWGTFLFQPVEGK